MPLTHENIFKQDHYGVRHQLVSDEQRWMWKSPGGMMHDARPQDPERFLIMARDEQGEDFVLCPNALRTLWDRMMIGRDISQFSRMDIS